MSTVNNEHEECDALAAKVQEHIAYSTGSENYHKHWLPGFVYTDGVRGVAELAGAYWLIDAIASHQARRAVRGNAMLQQFQAWHLKVNKGSAVLTCKADSSMGVTVRQKIGFTDFCLPEISLWVERGSYLGQDGQVRQAMVLMLPGEH